MFEALILAAGLGTRLKPWTDITPKPLIPFYGISLLDFAMNKMLLSGAQHVHINGHHLSKKIATHLEKYWQHKQPFWTFRHEAEILGTGGPIAVIRSTLEDRDLAIYNSDCLTTIEMNKLQQFHQSSQSVATMALLPHCPPGKNPVYVHEERVIKIGFDQKLADDAAVTSHTLSGVHMMGSKFRDLIPSSGFHDIRESYNKAFAKNLKIGAFIYDGPWFDLGEPVDYWKAHECYLKNPQGFEELKELGAEDLWMRQHPDWNLSFQFGDQQPRFFEWGPKENQSSLAGDLWVNTSGVKLSDCSFDQVVINSLPRTLENMSNAIVDGESRLHF